MCTGGANDNQWVDDFSIALFPFDSSSAEAGQTVSFTVTTDRPELFSVQPSVSPNGTLSYTPAPNACGSAGITVVARDSGGTAFGGRDTSAACSATINIVCQPDPPVINCSTNLVAECTGGLTPVSFTVTALTVEGVPVPVTCVPPSGTGFRIGTSNVVCTASDGGLSSSCGFTVTVVDTTPPTVRCPSNIVVTSTSATGAVVTYSASASDSCGIAAFGCTPPSGSTFPFGATTVTCRAADDAGNSNSCSFTVTVECAPNQCPVAVNQSIMVNEDSTVTIPLSVSDADAGTPCGSSSLSFRIITPPANGMLSGPAPNFVYTPLPGYPGGPGICGHNNGGDSFTYEVSDGVCSARATVSIVVKEVNDCPTAVADISPRCRLPGQSLLTIITCNGSNACIVLNGSNSSDTECDPLTYQWWVGNLPIAAGALNTNCFPLGTHNVTLVVSDGRCDGTQTVPVEIITVCDAIDTIIDDINRSVLSRKDKRPLIASLKAACASFEKRKCKSAKKQLESFIKKVAKQIGVRENTGSHTNSHSNSNSGHPIEAARFTAAAQSILDCIVYCEQMHPCDCKKKGKKCKKDDDDDDSHSHSHGNHSTH